MQVTIFFQIARVLYRVVLRDLLLQAVKSTENDLDDAALGVCDKVFGIDKD